MSDVQLHKHENVGEFANPCKEMVHVRGERFLFPDDAKTSESDSSVNAAH